jgi:hypothetical protein
MTKLKRPAAAIGKTMLMVLITFVLVEITVRIYKQFNPLFMFYDPSYNRFRGKPGAADYDFQLNSRGFKDVEFKLEKDAGTYRIVALGDSFAFGAVPYRHNYLTRLEQQLNSNGLRTEVVNMGIPSTGPQHYLALFATEGIVLKPDMVLVSFFIGNDITDTLGAGRPRLYEYSDAAALVKYAIDFTQKYQGQVVHGGATYVDDTPSLTDDAYLDLEKNRAAIYMKHEPLKQAIADAIRNLVRLKELCDLNRIEMRVVLIPDELQVNTALQAKVLKALNAGSNDFDFTLPNTILRERLRAHRIDYLDLLDPFLSVSTQTSLYRINDSHWNIAGNKLAAELIAGYLSRRTSADQWPSSR